MLQNIKLFMLDMDGTFYLDDTLLPGAKEFLAHCKKQGIAYTFLTNNSSKSKADYLAKLARLGVKLTQPSAEVRDRLRASYEQDSAQLIASSQVIAVHFQTVAAANNYWRN